MVKLATKCLFAGVAELVDALDLESSNASCVGSSPSTRTTTRKEQHERTKI